MNQIINEQHFIVTIKGIVKGVHLMCSMVTNTQIVNTDVLMFDAMLHENLPICKTSSHVISYAPKNWCRYLFFILPKKNDT